ncbi:hypothetical protein L7F22_065459 [Adiantum nelumboides]|nr:hypothetical protein [Adiantum nelumboides]
MFGSEQGKQINVHLFMLRTNELIDSSSHRREDVTFEIGENHTFGHTDAAVHGQDELQDMEVEHILTPVTCTIGEVYPPSWRGPLSAYDVVHLVEDFEIVRHQYYRDLTLMEVEEFFSGHQGCYHIRVGINDLLERAHV